MMKTVAAFMSIALILLLSACSGKQGEEKKQGNETETAMTQITANRELALPYIPASLKTPEEKTAFLAEHFWDKMDFRDKTLSLNDDFMEQSFANFIDLFRLTNHLTQKNAVKALLNRAEADKEVYRKLMDIAEKYLYDPNSPMLCEDYYILFLEEMLRSQILSEDEKLRPELQLKTAMKNRPGSKAADFTYIDRKGNKRTLYSTPTNPHLLLVFYDPECELCEGIMKTLTNDESLKSGLQNDSITVLAIYADSNRSAWERTKDTFPDEWIVGFNSSDIAEHELYALRAMPTIYLLTSDMIVERKDIRM